jgi:hypothetical protein
MLNYTDITQNTYVQSWTVTEIMAREVWNFDSCYSLIDYQIHIETRQEYVVSVMLISVLNIKVTCEWHEAIKLNTKTLALLSYVLRFPSTLRKPQLMLSCDVRATLRWLQCTVMSHCRAWAVDEYGVTDGVQYVDPTEAHTFRWPLSL